MNVAVRATSRSVGVCARACEIADAFRPTRDDASSSKDPFRSAIAKQLSPELEF
jgi:hypothetical protein